MTDHLSSSVLNALADGELSADQLGVAKEHLDTCPSCTSNTLMQALLKTATAKSGQRYTVPAQFQERMERLISHADIPNASSDRIPSSRSAMWVTFSGWAAAAVLLVVLGSGLLVQRHVRRFDTAAAERAAWITEVCDLHIGTLAANMPPQVISSDRHTVKPWFQGKIPFSFNLPENLPPDVKLDGANLTYLHNRPVAQLLYSLGRHRVSIFVQENPGLVETWVTRLQAEHAGFQITGFDTDDLEVIAVSDADPARLSGLVKIVEQAQTNTRR